MSNNRHEDIARFMEARQRGESTNQEMIYNPRTKKFELVDRHKAATDDLPVVTREDLQAFVR